MANFVLAFLPGPRIRIPLGTPKLFRRGPVLPDFPVAKRRNERQIIATVESMIPALTPLLQGVQTFRQHEGRRGELVRSDASTAQMNYPTSSFPITLGKDDVRSGNIPRILQALATLAKQMGQHREREMLRLAQESVEASGNTVDIGGRPLEPIHLLEMLNRTEMDFDPSTGEPLPGGAFVMSPVLYNSLAPKLQEWENDPAISAAYDAIVQKQREAWRDREARRALVD